MIIERISWQQTIPLRHTVLWPNKAPEFCHIDGDANAWHFGAFIDGELIAVASIYPAASGVDRSMRLRKFAIDESFQRKGIGSKMLNEIFAVMTANKLSSLWCDARESAIHFYEKNGMVKTGDRFYKSDVAYYKMTCDVNGK